MVAGATGHHEVYEGFVVCTPNRMVAVLVRLKCNLSLRSIPATRIARRYEASRVLTCLQEPFVVPTAG